MTDLTSLARLAAGSLSDADLLARFAAERDEIAFAALVERHGAVVLDAARAIVRNSDDADDVFQATFLVLARKAATVQHVGSWLHGVARRLALKALRARSRRTRHESAVRPGRPTNGDDLTWGEVRGLVHEELARLPSALREPILLCHLEGLTQDEAAARLDVPKGTLRGRLDRARAILRDRLARRGLALAAVTFPGALSQAVPPLAVLDTARFATGAAPTGRAADLAHGVLHTMTRTYLKAGLFLLVTAVTLVAAHGDPQPKGDPPPKAPPAAAKGDFEEVTIAFKPPGLSNQQPETVRIAANGDCLYEVPGLPARGTIPAWPPARITHKLPAERVRRLEGILKDTDWLAKAPEKERAPALHAPEYTLTLKRGGKATTITLRGEPEPYKSLLTYFQGVARQEEVIYRLQGVTAFQLDGRRRLDSYVRAELGEPQQKSPYEFDFTRFAPWATRIVRDPFGEQADDVATAVRLVGLLKLESERDALADLATDRDRTVRTAVAAAVGRLGGEKAIPVLRKMLRSTSEAAWELIRLGPIAVPTIAAVIRDGGGAQNIDYEWLIRAYIENWKAVPKPIDATVLDAVRVSLAKPDVQAHRTVYHKELLELAAEKK